MRNITVALLCFLIVCISACNNVADENETLETTAFDSTQSFSLDTLEYQGFYNKLEWMVDYDSVQHKDVLIKKNTNITDTLTPQRLIAVTNVVWENVQLQLEKIAHDTIFVSIPDSDYLTQSMGTSGLENYMASTTYSLTELRGIRFVNYRFGGNENTGPITVSRDDYKRFLQK